MGVPSPSVVVVSVVTSRTGNVIGSPSSCACNIWSSVISVVIRGVPDGA